MKIREKGEKDRRERDRERVCEREIGREREIERERERKIGRKIDKDKTLLKYLTLPSFKFSVLELWT